jgi:hypothetical protein
VNLLDKELHEKYVVPWLLEQKGDFHWDLEHVLKFAAWFREKLPADLAAGLDENKFASALERA